MPRGVHNDYKTKIKEMGQWLKEYPKATFQAKLFDVQKYLKECSHTEEEYEELLNIYNEFKQLYNILANRQSRKGTNDPLRLPDEIYGLCVKQGLGGVFPYPQNVREYADRYKIKPSVVNAIVKRYGSIEGMLQLYYDKELDEYGLELINKYSDNIVEVSGFASGRNYEDIMRAITKNIISPNDIIVFKSSRIDELMNKLVAEGKLTEGEIVTLRALFGISQQKMNVANWAKERGIAPQGIYQLKLLGLNKIRKYIREGVDFLTIDHLEEITTESPEEKAIVEELKKRIITSGVLIKTKEQEKAIPRDEIASLGLEELFDKCLEISSKNRRKAENTKTNLKSIRIEQLMISEETTIVLKRQGISTVSDLISISPRTIKSRMTPINGKSIPPAEKEEILEEIRSALKRINPELTLLGEIREDSKLNAERKITPKDFGPVICGELNRYGIFTIRDLSTISAVELSGMNNVGNVAISKIKALLAKYDLTLREDPEEITEKKPRKLPRELVRECGMEVIVTRNPSLEQLEAFLCREIEARKRWQEKNSENPKYKGDIGE